MTIDSPSIIQDMVFTRKPQSQRLGLLSCNWRGAIVNGSVEYRSHGEDMPRKPVYRRLTGNPFGKGKEVSCFPCPPARMGSGETRDTAPRDASLAGFGVESRDGLHSSDMTKPPTNRVRGFSIRLYLFALFGGGTSRTLVTSGHRLIPSGRHYYTIGRITATTVVS